jgi:hypothetical protein
VNPSNLNSQAQINVYSSDLNSTTSPNFNPSNPNSSTEQSNVYILWQALPDIHELLIHQI